MEIAFDMVDGLVGHIAYHIAVILILPRISMELCITDISLIVIEEILTAIVYSSVSQACRMIAEVVEYLPLRLILRIIMI